MSKRRKAVKSLFDYDTPETKKTLKDMGKPPSQRSKDATGTKRTTTTKKNNKPVAPPVLPKLSRKGPIAGATAIAAATALAPSKTKSYSIKGGDTLSQIAKRHGTTLKALLTANPQIKNANKIRVGQKIKLSKPVKGRKSVYQGMSKSEMAKIAKKKSGGVVKKAGGGMTRVGLSPAEMARAGTMSEAKRKRYMAKGGLVKRKHGGKVGPKEQDYKDRKDESIGIRLGKGKATQKNPNKAAKERNLSYGKYGKGTGKGKINRSGGDAFVAKGYA